MIIKTRDDGSNQEKIVFHEEIVERFPQFEDITPNVIKVRCIENIRFITMNKIIVQKKRKKKLSCAKEKITIIFNRSFEQLQKKRKRFLKSLIGYIYYLNNGK